MVEAHATANSALHPILSRLRTRHGTTASGLLATSSVLYAHAIGGFPFYDPLLLRIYRWGALLSLSGTVFAFIGVWRPGPLRWHAPACAVGTLLFWFAAAMGE
jgi:hypothetical protein